MSRTGGKKINKITYPEKYVVGIYIRTGRKVEGVDVIKFQKDRVEEYCNDMNLKVKDLYIDDGFDVFAENRPAYNKIIEDIKNGNINMIVTANLARIARSRKEMLDLLKLQEEYSFRTILVDSREELLKDRTAGANIEDYMSEDENELDEEYEEEESDEDMEF